MIENKTKHSVTVYLPRKNNSFLSKAIRARAIEKFGAPKNLLGRSSMYVMDLIYRDLQTRGLINDKLSPNEKLLQEINEAFPDLDKK